MNDLIHSLSRKQPAIENRTGLLWQDIGFVTTLEDGGSNGVAQHSIDGWLPRKKRFKEATGQPEGTEDKADWQWQARQEGLDGGLDELQAGGHGVLLQAGNGPAENPNCACLPGHGRMAGPGDRLQADVCEGFLGVGNGSDQPLEAGNHATGDPAAFIHQGIQPDTTFF